MLRCNLEQLAKEEFGRNLAKWKARKERELDDMITRKERPLNSLKGVPDKWVDLIRSQYKRCPACPDKITHPWHLKYKHAIKTKHIIKIWKDEILPVAESNRTRDEKRSILSDTTDDYLQQCEEAIKTISKC